MNKSIDRDVEKFLEDIHLISEEFYGALIQVRQIFFEECNILTEAIKYGGIVFFKDNELISGIFVHKKHLSIEFGNGAQLADPDSILEGKGKFRRHIKLTSVKDIRKKNVREFVGESIAIWNA